MSPLVLLPLLVAASEPRLLADEVSAGLGMLGTGYAAVGTRLGDAQLAPRVGGRVLWGGLVFEGGVLLVAPVTRDGAGLAVTAGLSLGWSGQRFCVVVGALGQWADGGKPVLQWLPTLRGSVDFGPFGLTLGVFDHLGLVPAHLSFDLRVEGGMFSLGWVAPIGLLASLELPVGARLGVRVTGFAYTVGSAQFAMLAIAGTFGDAR